MPGRVRLGIEVAWLPQPPGGMVPVYPRGARNAIYALELMAQSAREGRELCADNWVEEG